MSAMMRYRPILRCLPAYKRYRLYAMVYRIKGRYHGLKATYYRLLLTIYKAHDSLTGAN